MLPAPEASLTRHSVAAVSGKIDLKKTLPGYRATAGVFDVVDVPVAAYLMIDGHGDPNTSPAFAEALAALYPVAYKLKFASKRDLGRDYVVPPLEGLWWADDMDAFTSARDKAAWDWTMMLMVPDWLDAARVDTARAQAHAASRPTRLNDVRFETLTEGRCIQTLYIGSFDDEARVLDRMHHDVIPSQGVRLAGKHHEIYLSDFRRTTPAEQRTILRQPVAP